MGQKGKVRYALAQGLQPASLIAVAHQNEPDLAVVPGGEPGCLHNVLQPLLHAHVSGVQDNDVVLVPAEPPPETGPVRCRSRRQMGPIAYYGYVGFRDAQRAGDMSPEAVMNGHDPVGGPQ